MTSIFRQPFIAVSTAIAAVVFAVVASAQLGSAENSASDGAVFVPIDPVRVMDTRSDLGASGPLASATGHDLQLTGTIETAADPVFVPESASSVSLNVTIVRPSSAGFASVRPSAATGSPSTANVNFTAGGASPNAVTATLGDDGAIQIWIEGAAADLTADVIVDLFGYYDTAAHDHDERYYTKSSVDALVEDVSDAASKNATDINAIEASSATNAADIDAVESASATNAAEIDALNDTVAEHASDLLDLTTIPVFPSSTHIPVRRSITMTTNPYVTENVQIVPGFDLSLVCTGIAGATHYPNIGWAGGPTATNVVVFPNGNGQIGEFDTQTTPMGTIFHSLPAVYDLTMVADIGGTTTTMEVNVVVRVDGDTCTFDGSATASS